MSRTAALTITLAVLIAGLSQGGHAIAAPPIALVVDRGDDIGQSFGTLFEAVSDDGQLVVGAGFPNAYNTRYRGDRHAIQFFVRPRSGSRPITATELPRPSDLCGAYLFLRDGVVYSTYGGLKAWNEASGQWDSATAKGGTEESMRLADGLLVFGDSTVSYNGRTILAPPAKGSYQLFFYANGLLCFYHVHRNDRPYRPYESEEDGYSQLYACPWTPAEPRVDLSQAITKRLPVVGETTFAWGQLADRIVTGSNIGGFYVLENNAWQMPLAPIIGKSFQLYSSLAMGDRLLMGQYPTGRLFQFDGNALQDLAGWPPVPPGVSASAREAQTTAIYGGELFAGVWPWGELWRHHPDVGDWKLERRMFEHPEITDRVVHPYEVENRGNPVGNLWGQRVTSLVSHGDSLFVSTSAKAPVEWEPEKFPFLAPELWKSYGKVYRLRMDGHLSAPAAWTGKSSRFEFRFAATGSNADSAVNLVLLQDGKELARTTCRGALASQLQAVRDWRDVRLGGGLFGRFPGPKLNIAPK
ncbi:MAG: hypothetical protein KDB14_24500 [Planctomycetales bacterium]|nr:hypothetical protein [Planctomycetales bacterium]